MLGKAPQSETLHRPCGAWVQEITPVSPQVGPADQDTLLIFFMLTASSFMLQGCLKRVV